MSAVHRNNEIKLIAQKLADYFINRENKNKILTKGYELVKS